jgi:hypothetical protein
MIGSSMMQRLTERVEQLSFMREHWNPCRLADSGGSDEVVSSKQRASVLDCRGKMMGGNHLQTILLQDDFASSTVLANASARIDRPVQAVRS